MATDAFGMGNKDSVAAVEFDQKRTKRTPFGECPKCRFQILSAHEFAPWSSGRIACTPSQTNSTNSESGVKNEAAPSQNATFGETISIKRPSSNSTINGSNGSRLRNWRRV